MLGLGPHTFASIAAPPAAGTGDQPRSSALAGLAVGLGAALGAAATLAALGDAGIQAAAVGIATGSAGAVLTTLAAYLFLRRMHRTGDMADVVLTATLTLLSGVSIALVLLPTGLGQPAGTLMSVGGGLAVAIGFAMAGTTRSTVEQPLVSADRLLRTGIIAALALTAAIAAVSHATGIVGSTEGQIPIGAVGVNFIAGAFMAVASVGFARRCATSGEAVSLWLAVACAIGAVAYLSDAVVALASVDDFAGGDLVRVASWFALLVAGLRDFEWAFHRRAEAAVVDERRRLARELHDGLAQELAYITAEARRLAGHDPGGHLAEAAERALEESRTAILALSRPADEPLERLIADTAHSVADRAGVEVVVAVRPGLDAPLERRQALVRILRESMTNAIRHGDAGRVRVSVDGPSPLVMAVADDGSGFDVSDPRRSDSLGLQSMAERAANLGGRMNLDSSPGAGTTVAVVLP